MLVNLLRISNVYWADDTFQPPIALGAGGDGNGIAPVLLKGRFAGATLHATGAVTLTRDRLGLNKMFVSVHETGTILVGNFLSDLIRQGAPFECLYAVPPGHIVHIDPSRGAVEVSSYADEEASRAPCGASVDWIAREIRIDLDRWFSRLAAQFGHRRICVCLSGGLDSAIIAALARKYFTDVTAYTYSYEEPGIRRSDDAVNATRLADVLGMPIRIVRAEAADVLAALDDAICYGQDWRDFNVHCAIVNEILARAMRHDRDAGTRRSDVLVLTGDLANELLADYTPVSYDGREFYTLPDIDVEQLRRALVRGLDAGDREVGIFGRHGLDVVQPYSLIAERYLRLPGAVLGRPGSKQWISRKIAHDLLPDFVFDRVKVRAQIGNADTPTGIVPVLTARGFDQAWLRRAFCRLFGVRQEATLGGFIRGGRYRVVNRVLGGRHLINGYIAA